MTELFKLFGTIAINAGNAESEIDSIVSSAQEAGTALSQAGQQANNAGKQIGKNGAFSAGSVWLGNTLTRLTSAAASFGKRLISSGFEYNSQIEQLTVDFSTMMGGNTEAAEGLVAELQQLAKVTPMETLGLAKTANLLMGYGTSAEDVIATLTMLGDVAGGSQEKLNSIALAYGQAMAAGKLNAQDANQMITAGFPVWTQLAEYLNLSVADVRKLSEEGGVTADVLNGMFKSITSEGGQYYGKMEKQSKTYEGQLSTMQDAATQAEGALTKPFFDVISSDVLPQLLTLFEEFSSWCIENKDALLEFATALGKFTVDGISALLDTFKWLVEHEGVLTGVLSAIGLAFAGIAVATHPILAAIAGLTAFVMWIAGNNGLSQQRAEAFTEEYAAMKAEDAKAATPSGMVISNSQSNSQEYQDMMREAEENGNSDVLVENAGKYAHWNDVQKANAIAYARALENGFDTMAQRGLGLLESSGLTTEDITAFTTDVQNLLGQGDYSLVIEETWFSEDTSSQLQEQVDGMNLEATVSLVPDYSMVETYLNSGGTVIPGADGIHANGLDRVPFDGYRAILHKDEAVLNAANASVWRRGGGMSDTSRLEAKLDSLLTVMSQVVTNTGRNQTVVLDSGILVGQLAPQMDAQLGTMTARKGRRN